MDSVFGEIEADENKCFVEGNFDYLDPTIGNPDDKRRVIDNFIRARQWLHDIYYNKWQTTHNK